MSSRNVLSTYQEANVKAKLKKLDMNDFTNLFLAFGLLVGLVFK